MFTYMYYDGQGFPSRSPSDHFFLCISGSRSRMCAKPQAPRQDSSHLLLLLELHVVLRTLYTEHYLEQMLNNTQLD